MRLESILDHRAIRLALSPVLLPASGLYAAGLRLDRWRKRLRRLSLRVPTISVGNLTMGGTGKTPVLLRLVAELRAAGRSPLVLTRGYAGLGEKGPEGVVRSPADARGFSDEVCLMADALPGTPIVVAADRAAKAAPLISSGVGDVAVLDDGFQHWGIERNLDIVCVDAVDPWGGGFLIPLGRLREPVSALERAQVILLTRCEQARPEEIESIAAKARRASPGAALLRTRFSIQLVSPAGQAVNPPGRALAVSGIGNPAAFESNLAALGCDVVKARYPDHHDYSDKDIGVILRRADAAKAAVVTTEKDWMKLRNFFQNVLSMPELIVARLVLSFDAADDLAWRERLAATLRSTS